MPRTLAEFKTAFKDYTKREAQDKNAKVEEGLKGQVEYLQKQFDGLKKDLADAKQRMSDKLDQFVLRKEEESTATWGEKERQELRTQVTDQLKDKLGEVNSAFRTLGKRENFTAEGALEARTLLQEMEVMVDDVLSDGKTAKLAELLQARLERNSTLDALQPEARPEESSIHPLPESRAQQRAAPIEEGGTEQRSLEEMMKGRAEAQQWQEAEIRAVQEAHDQLHSLEDQLKYGAWIDNWLTALRDENVRRRDLVNQSIEQLTALQSEQKRAQKELDSLAKEKNKADEWLKDDKNKDAEERQRNRRQAIVNEYPTDILGPTATVQRCMQEIADKKLEIAQRVQDVNNDLNQRQLALQQKVAEFTRLAKEANDQLLVGELDVDLSKFRLDPLNLEVETVPKIGAAPKSDDVRINADKMFPELERTANKHGTGRHGAQTGIEPQARRLATGGTTPDQMGNEWGTSRQVLDDKGAPLQSVKWRSVTITWKEDEGKRTVDTKTVTEVERALFRELRSQGASASSMFLNPEVEQEAAQRAIQVAAQVKAEWTEVRDGATEPWKPLDRIVVTLSKPKRAAGYGHGLLRREGADRLELDDVNKLLEAFRQGRIDQNELLKRLEVSLTPVSETDSGAKLMPNCKVILDRVGGKWINTSQFPCEEPVGWSLKDKQVKTDTPLGYEVVGECVGA